MKYDMLKINRIDITIHQDEWGRNGEETDEKISMKFMLSFL